MLDSSGPMIGRRLTHYVIERHLGSGGMGEVYLARDLALGRPAAIKRLKSDSSGDLASSLKREAHVFARLQHPWIATFYEADEADGIAFLAMEYVPGETLRARLRSSGTLELEGALAIGSCMLEALAHAHAAGILHRDIKPENVMAVGSREAKLLDFGIAARLHTPDPDAAGATATRWTVEERAAGTPGYSAPEQLRGLPADARSDLFSVGTVLYEALTGRAAFPGSTPADRIAAILSRPSPLPSADLPREVAAVLQRALARDPSERYATAASFLADVRRLRSDRGNASALPDTIAVVDLVNVTGNPEDRWISSGIAESVAADLARVPGLRVLPRERILRACADGTPDPVELGHALGCRWVLSGGMQRMGTALRVTSRLTEVPTAAVVASEKIDGTLESIFAMQDRLAEAVLARLDLDRSSPTQPSKADPSLQAYELYARGKRLADRLEKGTLDQAQELFEESIRIEPKHAAALAGLAKVHAMKFTYTTDEGELGLAASYARRSIEADPLLGEPHSWLAYALFRQEDFDGAFELARRSEELEPSGAFGSYFCGCSRAAVGRHAEALAHFQRTVTIDPQHGFAWLGLGWTHLALGQDEEALWSLRQVVALEEADRVGRTAGAGGALAEAYRRRGALDQARQTALAALQAVERSDHMYRDTFRGVSLISLGRTSLDQNDREAARAAFGQALAHLRGRPRALGGGHLVVLALAGLAQANEDAALLEEAIALERHREGFNFSWSWCCADETTRAELERAAARLGRPRGEGAGVGAP